MKPFEESVGSCPTLVGGQGGGAAEVLAAGTVLGNYRIVRLLGAGGMGAVYLAEHVEQKTRHALKTIRPEFAKQQNFAERFQREAKLAMRLKHPHIVACTETGVAEGIPFLVMDYIEGPVGEPLNLRQLLDQRRQRGELLDEDEAAAVGLEICKALDYAHSYRDAEILNGIIHRDLKPANILLDKDTNLYIADFGLARVIGEQFEESVVRSYALSRSLGEQATLGKQASVSTDTVGTFDYMSPEQREGRVADARSDVFAMGVILYELLTGRKVVGVPAPPSSVRPALSPKWDEIILERALAYEPEERYATAGDFCRAIANVAEPSYSTPNPAMLAAASAATGIQPRASHKNDDFPPAIPPAKKRGKGWVIASGIACLLAGVGLMKWFPVTGQKPTPPEQKQMRIAPSLPPGIGSALPSGAVTPVAQSAPQPSTIPPVAVTPARSTQEVADAHQVGQLLAVDLGGDVKMEFVWISSGKFLMGSPANEAGRDNDESPQHEVTISRGFWMGKTEVTQRQYERLIGDNPSKFKGADLPVEQVDWNQAKMFCEKLQARFSVELHGKTVRLPTEAEWEYACRAGSHDYYAGELERMGWCGLNSGGTTHPVAQKQPNTWGLYDMHGNVDEWCRDAKREYKAEAVTNPEGVGSSRVSRGGSWDNQAQSCRSARRCNLVPDSRISVLGFRVVLDTPAARSVLTEQPISTTPELVPPSPPTKVFDLAADWSDTANPNGCWTYLANGTVAKAGIRGADPFASPGAPPIWGANSRFVGWSKSRGTELAKLEIKDGDVYAHTSSGQNSVALRWTSPLSGKIDLSGSIWALRNVGRSTEWRLLLNGREVATGIISGRTHTRAKPEVFQFEWSIREGDIIELNADKHDSISGDYFGLNMKIMPKF